MSDLILLNMKFDPSIFKAYDIRGKVPQELSEGLAFGIGHGFVQLSKQTNKKDRLTVVAGRDARESSPKLLQTFSAALQEEGVNVIDLGVVATPVLYFAVSHFQADGGVMITASHNPNPYNGIKLTRERGIPVGGESGLFWIRDYLQGNPEFQKADVPGQSRQEAVGDVYVAAMLDLAKVEKNSLQGISVVLDAGNGVAGPVALRILEEAGVKVYPLFLEPDGSFPNHVPDPLKRENLQALISHVRKVGAQAGIALDGDGDRVIFVTEKGEPVAGDTITALIAQLVLQQKKGKILMDIRSSRAVEETVKQGGGELVRSRIGHSPIKKLMREENVLFGGELSGHYYWGEPYFYEVPFAVALMVLNEMQNKPLSEVVERYAKYFSSGELNFEIQDGRTVMESLKQQYQGTVDETDGLRVDFEDWWFLVRPSNTEPLLRLIVEAKTKELLREKQQELVDLIQS